MHYLATPYTVRTPDGHLDMEIMTRRWEQTCVLVGALTRNGLPCFSPIVHWHPVAVRVLLPHDYAYWQDLNHRQIDLYGKILVPELPGSAESVGVKGECKYASDAGYPVEFLPEVRVLELLHEEGWELVI